MKKTIELKTITDDEGYATSPTLPDGIKNYLIDIDGTIAEVNQPPYENDKLLPGVKEMWAQIPKDDMIVIMTARPKDIQEQTLQFIKDNGLHYHLAIFGVHHGERIVVNDNKPGGLQTAIAWNVKRNKGYN